MSEINLLFAHTPLPKWSPFNSLLSSGQISGTQSAFCMNTGVLCNGCFHFYQYGTLFCETERTVLFKIIILLCIVQIVRIGLLAYFYYHESTIWAFSGPMFLTFFSKLERIQSSSTIYKYIGAVLFKESSFLPDRKQDFTLKQNNASISAAGRSKSSDLHDCVISGSPFLGGEQ